METRNTVSSARGTNKMRLRTAADLLRLCQTQSEAHRVGGTELHCDLRGLWDRGWQPRKAVRAASPEGTEQRPDDSVERSWRCLHRRSEDWTRLHPGSLLILSLCLDIAVRAHACMRACVCMCVCRDNEKRKLSASKLTDNWSLINYLPWISRES